MPKYRNNFEKEIGEVLGDSCEYEPFKVPYTVKRNYLPDFYHTSDGVWKTYVEAKGYFRVGDTQKYKAIRDSLGKDEELVFCLYNPRTKLRKGSKMTLSEWCEKEGFEWYTLETIHKLLEDPWDAS